MGEVPAAGPGQGLELGSASATPGLRLRAPRSGPPHRRRSCLLKMSTLRRHSGGGDPGTLPNLLKLLANLLHLSKSASRASMLQSLVGVPVKSLCQLGRSCLPDTFLYIKECKPCCLCSGLRRCSLNNRSSTSQEGFPNLTQAQTLSSNHPLSIRFRKHCKPASPSEPRRTPRVSTQPFCDRLRARHSTFLRDVSTFCTSAELLFQLDPRRIPR